MGRVNNHAKGYLLALIGIVILSPDALLIRLIDAPAWAITTWRGLLGGAVMLVIACWLERQGPWQIVKKFNALAYLGVANMALSMGAFVAAVNLTTAANVFVIIAFSPLLSTLLSWFFLKERIPLRTWVAVLVCVLGIVGIFAQDMQSGDLGGKIWAMICGLTLAIHMIVARRYDRGNPVSISAFGYIVGGIAAGFLANWQITFNPEQLLWVGLMTLIVNPVSFALLTLAPKYILPPEVGLVMQLESVFGSLLVWWGVGEAPSAQTIVCGILVLGTLCVHSWLAIRSASTFHEA